MTNDTNGIIRDDYAVISIEGKNTTIRHLKKENGDCFFVTLPRRDYSDEEFELFRKALDKYGITPALIWGDLSDLGVVSREELIQLRDTLNEFLGEK